MSSPTAIITGAAGAIAGHLIEALQARDWTLALVAHDEASGKRVASAHAGACVVTADLTDREQAQVAMDTITSRCGPVTALFNIAGGFAMSDAARTTPAQLDAQLDINLRTAFNATTAVLPHMLEHQRGFVLAVGAMQAISGGAAAGPYAASKAALIAWLQSMHAELGSRGIEIGIVYPMGAVDTPANRAAMPDVDPATWIDADELAASMAHLASRGPRGHVREAKVYPPAA